MKQYERAELSKWWAQLPDKKIPIKPIGHPGARGVITRGIVRESRGVGLIVEHVEATKACRVPIEYTRMITDGNLIVEGDFVAIFLVRGESCPGYLKGKTLHRDYATLVQDEFGKVFRKFRFGGFAPRVRDALRERPDGVVILEEGKSYLIENIDDTTYERDVTVKARKTTCDGPIMSRNYGSHVILPYKATVNGKIRVVAGHTRNLRYAGKSEKRTNPNYVTFGWVRV